MPGDLLRYVTGPTAYSSWWSWLAAFLLALVIAWYTGVVLLTRQSRRLRDVPLVGFTHDRLLKHRFANAVRTIGDRHRLGELAAAPAAAAVTDALRAFLHKSTGAQAQYMQLDDIATGELAPAADLLAHLDDARFNPASQVDVAAASESAEELIRSWT